MSIFRRRPARVYVLGAGPAGLLAAQAARDMGYTGISIFTSPDDTGQPRKSALYGCQYLHAHIPDLTVRRNYTTVKYQLNGSVTGYRRKVYGDGWDGVVSPDEYGPEAEHRAWDLRAAYDELWHRWEPSMQAMDLSAKNVSVFTEDPHAVTLSTIPAMALCKMPNEHKFVNRGIWAMGSAPGVDMPYVAPEDTVECNGNDAPRWYRAATVFGHSTLEWPAGVRPPISGVAAVRKPLSTDCDCWLSRRYHRLGRYGQWRKGVLAHTAYLEPLYLLA